MLQSSKYSLITGASSGIGFEYACQLAERGYNIVMVSNDSDALLEKARYIVEKYHVDVVPLVRDLALPDAAKELYHTCCVKNLNIEVLVNNAGIYHFCDFVRENESFNEKILFLHVNTPAMLTYYFGNDMVKSGVGYILNMSSVTASIPVQGLATYGSTKSFLKNFSRSVHVELYYSGVYVTAVCPGAVATNLYNLSDKFKLNGIKAGYIMTPRKLANKALKALFHKKATYTPLLFNHIALLFIRLIPMWQLLWLRKHNII